MRERVIGMSPGACRKRLRDADYRRAEAYGCRSVEPEPRDGWGWHAVAHVMEMQNRRRDGVAWLSSQSAVWSEGSFVGPR